MTGIYLAHDSQSGKSPSTLLASAQQLVRGPLAASLTRQRASQGKAELAGVSYKATKVTP